MDDDVRGAVSDLGGGTPEGGEPDIFADAPPAGGGSDGGSNSGSSDQGGSDAGTDEGTSESGNQATEGEGAGAGDQGDDGGGSEDGQPAGEGEPAEGAEKPPVLGPDGKPVAAAPPKDQKPLTEEEKQIEATLQESYRDSPKFKEMFKQFPEARAPFFKAAQINKLFPGGVSEAEKAKEWSRNLFEIDNLYFGGTPESTKDFLRYMYEAQLDLSGDPTTNPNYGKSAGHYERAAQAMTNDLLGNIETRLSQMPTLAGQISSELNQKQVSTAIEIVRRAAAILSGQQIPRGGGSASRTAAPQPINLPADATPREKELAAQLAKANETVASLTQSGREAAEAADKEAYGVFQKSIWDSAYSGGIKEAIDKRLPNLVKGNQWLTSKFGEDVLRNIQLKLDQDDYFDLQLRQAERSGDRGQRHVSEMGSMLKQRILLLIPDAVREVTDSMVVKNGGSPNSQGQGGARTSGRTAPRREPATGGSPGRLTKPGETGGRPGSRQPDRAAQLRSSGDYTRDANKLLGIEE